MPGPSRAETLLPLADDELIVGWRNSEWTGIAPFLEEDVAFSSIAQNEIGHARALYELVAEELGTTADELAFDRAPGDYRCAPLVQLRRMDWAATIARHVLYETADAIRIEALSSSDDPVVAGIAAPHRPRGGLPPHARRDVARAAAGLRRGSCAPRGGARRALALRARRPRRGAAAGAPPPARGAARPTLPDAAPVERGTHEPELAELLDEMTSVRRPHRRRGGGEHGDGDQSGPPARPSGRRSTGSRTRRSR